ncbi:energy transducer TonB [Noviherbaspirillum cavernae]|uniref:Energy transducer TonB n=1 Tax=Noviherbaspirillum cavernae TaxID=2320862 RepID=A0A418WY22_9BURK|nr:TonB family protein [Noviherbaspirillum cavernae]RJG05107.1 energy transducer TonB [Noviherbaspirillum cavernae]
MFIRQNRTLTIAIAISVLVHGALLAVRFVAPDSFKFEPTDPGLEVILVNAKHDKKPVKADALAQANLDGGGNAEAGRSKSPLPDMRKNENGESLKTMQRRIEEMEKQQQEMLAQLNKKTRHAAPQTKDAIQSKDAQPRHDGKDVTDSDSEIRRSAAEIAKDIEDYNKRPKKTMISPSTREVGYAMYYNALRERIEKVGTLNFPQKDGRKLYGELVLSISIYQDGTIYDKDGGLTVDKSSGNPALDEAAKRIVRRSAPFGKFPQNMRSAGKDDVWVLVTNFKFTREGGLEANLRGGGQ